MTQEKVIRKLHGKSYLLTMRSPLVKSVLIMAGATLLSTYLGVIVPFHKLPLSHFWKVIVERSVASSMAVAAIWYFYPNALHRFRLRVPTIKLLVSLGFVLYLGLPSLFTHDLLSSRIPSIIEGFIFALFIGIDEEIFSRGLIFASLERYGIWIAATISSIHFGLLHLGNVIWGGQSWAYTSAQVINAGAFGFLCVGLLIYSGSIWIPVLLHGLNDTPMQFESQARFTAEVTGNPNWLPMIALAIIQVAFGWGFIVLNNPTKALRIKKFFRDLCIDLMPSSFFLSKEKNN